VSNRLDQQPLLVQPAVLELSALSTHFLLSFNSLGIIHLLKIIFSHFKGYYRYSIIDLRLSCSKYSVTLLIILADTITVLRAFANSVFVLVASGIICSFLASSRILIWLSLLDSSQFLPKLPHLFLLLVQFSLLVFQLHLFDLHLGF